MRLLTNQGANRVIDELRASLAVDGSLDAASPGLSIFAYGELRDVLCRRTALADHNRLTREIASLRARADKESQLNRRVELNLLLKQLESQLAEVGTHL